MLEPNDRQPFLEAVRPPDGYQFDAGLGTTFTLDLLTLMAVPLSLALADQYNIDQALQDPLILMECLQRYTNRLMVFCQAGYISIPKNTPHLFQFLENQIIEVHLPRQRIFHPKLWLLRYTSPDNVLRYRLLVLTRNLTADRSWDLILHLEGQPNKESQARNRPLQDFLLALGKNSQYPIPVEKQELIELFRRDLRHIRFESPQGFDYDFNFVPIGIPGHKETSFEVEADRCLVISPFLTDSILEQVTSSGKDHVLISRQDSLNSISPAVLKRFQNIYILDEMADEEPEDSSIEVEDPPSLIENELRGLHAKLFVWEKNKQASWLIGSANATQAAFHENIEFDVRLHGKDTRVGISQLLGNDNDNQSLLSLLDPYHPPDALVETDRAEKKAEVLANIVRSWLIEMQFQLTVLEVGEDDNYRLIMNPSEPVKQPPGDYTIHAWPVGLPRTRSQQVKLATSSAGLNFGEMDLLSLTSFIAFEVSVVVKKASHTNQFVLNLPIIGLPKGRSDALLREVITNKSQFLRYLRLLLAEEDFETSESGLTNGLFTWGPIRTTWEDLDMPLLEDLARTLSRSPNEKIARIAEIVKRIKNTPQWQEVIPEDFDRIWPMILGARELFQ